MKSFNQLFSFIICSALSFGFSNLAYAEGQDIAATNYSAQAFNPKDFCDGREGAEKLMEDLDKENAKAFEKIKIYKEEIDELVESDKLVNSIRELKNQYLKSLNEIENLKDNPDFSESLNNLNVAVNAGAVLDGVRNPTSPTKRKYSNAYIKRLQNIVSTFSNKVAQNTRDRMNKTVDKIPEDISPAQTSMLIETVSPTINNLLEKNVTKENFSECFSKNANEDNCKNLGIALSERDNFIKTINKEREALFLQISNKPSFTQVAPNPDQNVLRTDEQEKRLKYDAILSAQERIKEFENILNTFAMPDKSNDLELSDSDMLSPKTPSEKARDEIAINEKQLLGTEILFYHFSIDMEEAMEESDLDMNTDEGAIEAIRLQKEYQAEAVKNAAELKNNCNFYNKDISQLSKEKINTCFSLIETISEKFDIFNESHIYRISNLNSKIKKLTSENNFGDIETMKKYVAEKYMCSCMKNKNQLKINKDQESLILASDSCPVEFLSISKIEGLSDKSSFIANALYANEIKIPRDNQSCEKTPDELRSTAKTCETNRFISTKFADLCGKVQKEYTVKHQNKEIENKRNADLEKLNKENYVEYDSSSPTGHKVIKKKSNWQVAGEGMLPVLPNVLPMWLGNFQMKNNINMLTSQALFQKQYLHNVGFYNQSPWSFNNFNYLGYGNPFMPSSTTSPAINNGLGGSGGFNFGM